MRQILLLTFLLLGLAATSQRQIIAFTPFEFHEDGPNGIGWYSGSTEEVTGIMDITDDKLYLEVNRESYEFNHVSSGLMFEGIIISCTDDEGLSYIFVLFKDHIFAVGDGVIYQYHFL